MSLDIRRATAVSARARRARVGAANRRDNTSKAGAAALGVDTPRGTNIGTAAQSGVDRINRSGAANAARSTRNAARSQVNSTTSAARSAGN
ncbi:MAG: hypothetical protein AAFQ77_03705, partial [Myxococcota bacterium]